ncbi:hypothetical protein RHODGE_RHODGE_02820 [Rhodoplanes serenus]|uniref:Phage terminase small subunit P27 family n=1 Tax=Rhodoplanes serenus TaxID=200615 RepID=A0A447CWR0_9BRAD|nr:hypothetical protein RHODGE_RHODGE_02820 [Rhodoplanes serenus]
MRGRRPEPAGVKQQKQAVRSARKPRAPSSTAAIVAPTGMPAAPAWLKEDGRKIWARLAPALYAAKLLTAADAMTFARYCANFAKWLKMQRMLAKDGEVYWTESQHGKLRRAHPAFGIADRVERQLLAAEDRFGLNPAERQRIFAARAQTGVSGDLFDAMAKLGTPSGERRPDDPAASPTPPAQPAAPIGFLRRDLN